MKTKRTAIAVPMIAFFFAALSLTGCDDGTAGGGGGKTLSGDVTISPSANVTTGTELTADYSGSEAVSYQWNKGGTAVPGAVGGTYIPGEIRTISLSSNGSLFTVGSGITLILDNNITLQGRPDNTASLVSVTGSLVMNEGAQISGNTFSGSIGSRGSGGSNGLSGTSDSNPHGKNGNPGGSGGSGGAGGRGYGGGNGNSGSRGSSYGSGVYVAVSGTFTKNGGIISNNSGDVNNQVVFGDQNIWLADADAGGPRSATRYGN